MLAAFVLLQSKRTSGGAPLPVAPDNCNASYPGTPVSKSASELIKQEIYFAMQTLVYELAYSATASATWR